MPLVSLGIVERWLKGVYGITVNHCDSCHSEWDEDDEEPLEIELGKGRFVFGCCGLSEAIESH